MAGRVGIRIFSALAVFLLLAGLGILLYPGVSDWWNGRVQSRLVDEYHQAAADLKAEERSLKRASAQAYNEALAAEEPGITLEDPDRVEGYETLLDITGSGIMGYLTIEKIHVELPIYHGTTSSVLSAGVGHLQGSSLPIGGESTHAVLSAHRGLPTSMLFTNLDKLEVGDRFTITVLERTLVYQVDQIVTVLPREMEELYIQPGADLVTLVTCTPYGINDHRLLVRGVRMTEQEGEEGLQTLPPDSFLECAVPALVVLVTPITLGKRPGRRPSGRGAHRRHTS